MPKVNSVFICQQCGYESIGWLGKCPNCESWGTLVETIVSPSEGMGKKGKLKSLKTPVTLTKIPSKKTLRTSTKISELDRVLGGGLISGQVTLLAGEPGIGKSTLLLQLAESLGAFFYVCGEESAEQIKLRADRISVKRKDIFLLEETNVDLVLETFKNFDYSPKGIVIDSIQTMATEDLSGVAGSVGQVRECTFRLMRFAKERKIPIFLVGHVTKEGTVAGPATLAHMVDTLLWFEGDKSATLRILRAVKNRFGPTDEVGIFEMQEKGLIPITNAEKIFLTKSKKQIPGSVVSSILQGTRPILVEVQSLVVPTKMPFPKRVALGIDSKRLEIILAILIRRCGLPLYEYDVFVNIAGGIKVTEPSSDLAICLSIASAFFDKAIATNSVAIGEVGLLGEIRDVVAQEKRVKEAKRLGFSFPISNKEVKYINEAIKRFLK